MAPLRIKPVVPQLVTAGRLVLGLAALVLALEGDDLYLAATLITLGAVLDGLDGPIARWLNVTSPFGALFDYFTDYLTLIVAPWVLTRAMLIGRRSLVQEMLLDLPLMIGAVRYARVGGLVAGQTGEVRTLPGLDPAFFAFVSVTAVFLHLPALVAPTRLAALVIPLVAVLSVLMVVPVRYPRLTLVPGLSVLVFLAAMPFVETEILAAAAIMLGLLYVLVAPLFARPAALADLQRQ